MSLLAGLNLVAAPPNVVIILLDDMGYSDLGSFGGEIETPHMDALAKGGLRFTQSYNSARCCPSRASLLTGLYSHQTGIANFTGRDRTEERGPAYLGRLNKTCVTLGEVLRAAGYATYGVGKWHVGHQELPTDRGFDEYYGYVRGYAADQWDPAKNIRLPEGRALEIEYDREDFYATDAFSDYAVEFVRQGQSSGRPFFLYLAHSSPHFPLHAPASTRDKYVATYLRGWDTLREKRYERQMAIGLADDSWSFTGLSQVPEDKPEVANHYAGQVNPTWDSLEKDRQVDLAYRMATFAAMIEHVDIGVGRIVEALEENGDLENTLILVTSDNGACYEWGPYGFDGASRRGINIVHEAETLNEVGGPGTYHSVGSAWSCLSNTPLRMYKHFNHEGGNCSPLIAHWPNGIQKPDRWVRDPVHLIDFMPTIREVSGANYPAEFNGFPIAPEEGLSWVALFENRGRLANRTLYFDHFESSAVRQGPWKLVRGNSRYNNRTWELYNINEDRCETENLVAVHPEIAEKLRADWLSWAMRVNLYPYVYP